MIFQKWFPTIISITENLLNKEELSKLINLSMQVSHVAETGGHNWISKSNFNTQSTYNLIKDKNLFGLESKQKFYHLNTFEMYNKISNLKIID